jgi:hypothetical protein
MFRRFGMPPCIFSLVFAVAEGASAQSLFYDLSGLAGDTAAYPCGVDSVGQVSLMGYYSTNGYVHQYFYTGGAAGTMNDINSLFTTGNTFSNAINGSGQMAVNGVVKAWLYSGGTGGTVTPIVNGTLNTNAACIDSAGDVGGATVYPTNSGVFTPYVYTGGSMYVLNSPYAGIQAGIIGMNNYGQACGYNKSNGGDSMNPPGLYATVWTYTISNGSISDTATDISPYLSAAFPTYEASQAFVVNNSGNVVGGWSNIYGGNQNQDTGFYVYNIASHGVTPLPAAFSVSTVVTTAAFGAGMSQLVNDNNQVVGQIDIGGVEHAAIWSAASGLQDLNTLYASFLPSGFVLNNATAIDDNGDIVGVGTDSLGNANQAFLLRQFLPGDANEDGKVDINDLTIVLAHYGQSGTTWSQGEFTGDGTVDINDLTIVLAHYGQSLGATASGMAAVPEPSCAILLGVGALVLLGFARRGCSEIV